MRTRLFVLILTLILYTSAGISQAVSRSVVCAGGTQTIGENYTVSQTIGETFAHTFFANFRFTTQGFQQPTLINFKSPDEEDPYDAIDVYPNPVTRSTQFVLTVSFRINELSDYVVEIFDTQGKRLYFDELNGLYSQDIKIDLADFRQSIYFVHVYSVNRRMDRYFKIEKF